jgi:hypothetical protein
MFLNTTKVYHKGTILTRLIMLVYSKGIFIVRSAYVSLHMFEDQSYFSLHWFLPYV